MQSRILKLPDLVEFQTAQLMFKAKNNKLPANIQKREGSYFLRGLFNFKMKKVRTTRKSFCISVCGVKLWNGLKEELKQCPNLKLFKTRLKEVILTGYKDEGVRFSLGVNCLFI